MLTRGLGLRALTPGQLRGVVARFDVEWDE